MNIDEPHQKPAPTLNPSYEGIEFPKCDCFSSGGMQALGRDMHFAQAADASVQFIVDSLIITQICKKAQSYYFGLILLSMAQTMEVEQFVKEDGKHMNFSDYIHWPEEKILQVTEAAHHFVDEITENAHRRLSQATAHLLRKKKEGV
jgi:hypothetical protein